VLYPTWHVLVIIWWLTVFPVCKTLGLTAPGLQVLLLRLLVNNSCDASSNSAKVAKHFSLCVQRTSLWGVQLILCMPATKQCAQERIPSSIC